MPWSSAENQKPMIKKSTAAAPVATDVIAIKKSNDCETDDSDELCFEVFIGINY